MDIELTKRAQIALEHLPAPEKKRVQRLLDALIGFPLDTGLHRIVNKFQPSHDPDLFIGKAGLNYRVIFRQKDDLISVLEIIHASRLESIFGRLQGGSQ
jgi:mRNA-degrading endonuclease RelE of RelBE toxin-antitoxin system